MTGTNPGVGSDGVNSPLRYLPHGGLTEALAARRHTVVWFTAAWCGPCQQARPALQRYAQQHEAEVAVWLVDIDDQPELAAACQVRAVPAFSLYVDAVRIWHHTGLDDPQAVGAMLDAGFKAASQLHLQRVCPPQLPQQRAARDVVVPAHGVGVRVMRGARLPLGEDARQVEAGPVRVEAGEWLGVMLEPDYRREEPLDLAALSRFQAGDLDEVDVLATGIDIDLLRGTEALSRTAVVRWGSAARADQIEEVFPAAVWVDGDVAGLVGGAVTNGWWAAAEMLDAVAPFEPAARLSRGDGGAVRCLPGLIVDARAGLPAGWDEGLTALWLVTPTLPDHGVAGLAELLHEPGPHVRHIVADACEAHTLAALLGVELFWAPACVLMAHGREVWRLSDLSDVADPVTRLCAAATRAAAQPAAGLPLVPVAPRARVLNLPDTLQDLDVLLAPPGRSDGEGPRVTGGRVDVPVGWQVKVRVAPNAAGRCDLDEALAWSGPDDIDIVGMVGADLTAADLAELRRLTGLRIVIGRVGEVTQELEDAAAALTQLRQLWLRPADAHASARLAALRRRLPRTAINGYWQAWED